MRSRVELTKDDLRFDPEEDPFQNYLKSSRLSLERNASHTSNLYAEVDENAAHEQHLRYENRVNVNLRFEEPAKYR